MGCCLASAIDAKEAQAKIQEEAPEIILEGETFEFAFAYSRDEVYFTNFRILERDKKGLTGSSIGYKSIPYPSIKAFFIETAGTLDLDVSLQIWPSGMDELSISFKKDGGVDLFALQRMLNQKVFRPNAGPLEVAPQPEGMEDKVNNFMDMLLSDGRAIDPKMVEEQLKVQPPILDQDETVDMAFRCGRDTTCFTDERILVIDVKGWTGKKVNYKSFLWSCIRAWAVATPGAFLDRDAEMKVWTTLSNSNDNKFEMDLRNSAVDIMSIKRYLSDRLLGTDTAPMSAHASSMEGVQDTGGGWQAWLGDVRQIDAKEADRQFHQTTPLLQGCETVEMAFKGKRDMILFTTKRMVLIDPQGWTGKKISYTSVPWGTVQAFGVQSAGSWDKDAEMMIWTDIFYDIERQDDKDVPVPGMSYIEQDFHKDKVDLPVIGRYLASKCAKLGSQSSQPAAPLPSNFLQPGDPQGAEKVLNWLGSDYRQVDPDELDAKLHGECSMLLPEEKVQLGFVCGRDTLILTTHRAIKIDVQGWTGKRVLYFSLPYTSIRGYSMESAGSWDRDAEMSLYHKAPGAFFGAGTISIDFRKGRADVVALQKFISSQVIGTADGTSSVPRTIWPEQPEGVVGLFLNWLGDDHHQISQEEVTKKLTSDPEILLPDETVDLAFKCGRDLSVFTTKRFLFVNVQGAWGTKRVDYTSVPYRFIPSFQVTGAAQHPFDLDSKIKLYTDCPATEKVKIDLRKGQADVKTTYAFLCKKCITDVVSKN